LSSIQEGWESILSLKIVRLYVSIFRECQDKKIGEVSLKGDPVAKGTFCSSETWSSGHENTAKSSVLKSTL